MTYMKNSIVRGIMGKMGASARLGGFTEEMLSSLKLIVSFGKEDMKLKEYKNIAYSSYKTAARSAIISGYASGMMFGTVVGFSCFSWGVGLAFIKYDINNPRYDRVTTVGDIVTCYQALMFAMFTVL